MNSSSGEAFIEARPFGVSFCDADVFRFGAFYE
jgi:hypothetical protein